ncbi:MAG: NAD(P)/FAD-dependent oxidoreductase [Betaproteobacteria bacterium]|nr:NAD(P)/FAD-dependent oxidoreductase [Betaproteobacteria bacterium]
MNQNYDAIIIGAGHNGLTCAAYLAAAGLQVLMLERRGVVGGAAVTEEFFPGFRNSTASYTVSLLAPEVIRDLRLAEHGLRIIERPYSNFLPLPDAGALRVGGGLAATQAEVARFSRRDAERLPEYYARLEAVAEVLRRLAREIPPNVGGGLTDWLRAGLLGKKLGDLPMAAKRDALELFTKSAGELLDAWFESAPIKAAFGFDAVVGNYASPYAPGTAYVLLHHVFGEVNGKRGIWGHALGGMGAITEAMAQEARARGVTIVLEAPVAKVLVREGRARGVVLADGREFSAPRVIANVNPKLLCLEMIEPAALPADFLQRMRHYACGSGTLRINVALAQLPDFRCAPGTVAAPHHRSGIIMAPSLAYLDRAYDDARREGFAREPIVEMLLPSIIDDRLAPPGQHVASLFCQHFAPTLPQGRDWDREKAAAVERVFAVVEAQAPNFRAALLGYRALTPLDLEREFGLLGGDIFHGRLSLDQLFSARPVLGHADHRLPLQGLYLCGSGAHPGGGVSGLPGRNAAREILRDRSWWRRRP